MYQIGRIFRLVHHHKLFITETITSDYVSIKYYKILFISLVSNKESQIRFADDSNACINPMDYRIMEWIVQYVKDMNSEICRFEKRLTEVFSIHDKRAIFWEEFFFWLSHSN